MAKPKRTTRLNSRRLTKQTGRFLQRLGNGDARVLEESFFFKGKAVLCITAELSPTQIVQTVIPLEEIDRLRGIV